MGRPNIPFSREIFLRLTMFLLGSIGMVGTTVEVSICEITVFVEMPKRACTWAGSMKLTNLGSPTNKKDVLFDFYTSGRLRISNG